jgi:hypothetical protein
MHTSQGFFDLIQDEVHELVVAFERANDCRRLACDALAHTFMLSTAPRCVPSRPPLNLTVICLSMYLLRSRMFSFLGRSACPPAPPACAPPRPPPRPPRSPPLPPPRPRNAPRSDMVVTWREREAFWMLELGVTCSSGAQAESSVVCAVPGKAPPTPHMPVTWRVRRRRGGNMISAIASRRPPCRAACMVAARFSQDAWACGIFSPCFRTTITPAQGPLHGTLKHLTHSCHGSVCLARR